MVEVGATSVVSKANVTELRRLTSLATSGTDPRWATPTSTPSSTITPVSHTPRYTTTRRPSPPPVCCAEQPNCSPTAVSRLSGFYPTTAARTGRSCGAIHAKPSPPSRSSRAPTGHRPTGRSSVSTEPWPTAGPTPVATALRPSAATPSMLGCTTTTSIGPTRRAAISRPSPGQPSSPVSTYAPVSSANLPRRYRRVFPWTFRCAAARATFWPLPRYARTVSSNTCPNSPCSCSGAR